MDKRNYYICQTQHCHYTSKISVIHLRVGSTSNVAFRGVATKARLGTGLNINLGFKKKFNTFISMKLKIWRSVAYLPPPSLPLVPLQGRCTLDLTHRLILCRDLNNLNTPRIYHCERSTLIVLLLSQK